MCSPAFITKTINAVQGYYFDKQSDLRKELDIVLKELGGIREKISAPDCGKEKMESQRQQFRLADDKRKVLEESLREASVEDILPKYR